MSQKIISKINPAAKIITDTERIRPEKSEVERLMGSNEKIMRLTDWSPKISLDKGLDLTIEWFKNAENLKRYKADIYNV